MTVIRVDLRRRADAEADRVVDDAVARALGADEPRFLVVADAAELVGHRLLFEELLAHESVPAVCLAVGPPEADDGAAAGGPSAQLLLPQCLKPPTAGVLWAPDPDYGTGGDAGSDDDRLWRAVRPLARLLEEPHVFDAVLHALGDVRHGTAVAAPHVLEHDLTESARTRVWRQALENLCGREVHTAVRVSGDGEERLPRELAPLVGDEVPKALGDRVWAMPHGEADERRRDCEAALREAQDVHQTVRAPFAWVREETSARAGLQDRLSGTADALAAYRGTVEECLREGDGVRLTQNQRAALARRGVDLPDVPEASREHVGPGLRRYTEKLIDRPLSLRSAAARLAALADGSAPAGSAARLGELERACPREYVDALRRPAPFHVMAPGVGPNLLPGFLTAFVAGLWPGVGWGAGLLLALLTAGLAALMQHRRPNRTADARTDGGGQSAAGWYAVSGLIGAVAGAAAGQRLMLPVWAGAAAVAVAVAGLLVFSTWQWTRSVDDWWARMRPEDAAPMWVDVETVLSEAAVHDWMLAEARLHCADGARAVSVLLRKFAAEIEEQGVGAPAGTWGPEETDLFAAVPAEPAERAASGALAASGASAASGADADAGEPDGDAEPWDWDSWADDPEPAAPEPVAPAAPEPALAVTDAPEFPDSEFAAPEPPAPDHDPVPVPEEPPRPLELWWLTRESGDAGRVLVDTLVRDLADGVVGVLAGCWGVLENDPGAVSRFRVTKRVGELLDEERACLDRDGAAAPPRHAARREDRARPGTAELLGIATDRVARVLAEGEAKAPQPLCSPARKRMLSRDPGAARTVRFAPEAAGRGAAARDLLGDGGWDAAGDDVVRTQTGRFAGVLRLVPLSGGAVRTVRSHGGTGGGTDGGTHGGTGGPGGPNPPHARPWGGRDA